MGTLLSRPKAKNQSTRKDVRSAKRPDNPDYGVLALIHKKASKPKKTKPLIDARPEKGKISIAKMYEQRYRPAFSGVDKQAYCGTYVQVSPFISCLFLTNQKFLVRFWVQPLYAPPPPIRGCLSTQSFIFFLGGGLKWYDAMFIQRNTKLSSASST